jgi:DNA transformation protein
MAVSQTYRDYVVSQLEVVGVTSRAMFGGVGIYHKSQFFALIYKDALYFKVGDTNRGDYENAGMKPFQPYPDRSGKMSYYEVPGEVIDDTARLKKWALKAVDVARKAKTRTKKPRKRA